MENLKELAGYKAAEYVKSGMVIGLGTGSTAYFATIKIGSMFKSGELKNIKCIPTSISTEKLALELGLPLATFSDVQEIDITIDGADEVDKYLNLIKGGGGAHLREKIVAQATKELIIIVNESKISKQLGENWAVPVEVLRYAYEVEKKYLESLGADTKLRQSEGDKFITDEGNWIIDANFGVIENPSDLAAKLNARAGIAEHGLFINLAKRVIVASSSGIKILEK